MIVYDILKVLAPYVRVRIVKSDTVLHDGIKANISFYITQLNVKTIDIEHIKEIILCIGVWFMIITFDLLSYLAGLLIGLLIGLYNGYMGGKHG